MLPLQETPTMDYILLNELEFHAFHGVLPQETLVGNTYIMDLKLGVDLHKACHSDRIEDTLNYADVIDCIRIEMKQPSKLIEHVAERICEALKAQFPQIISIDIHLQKRNPPVQAQLKSASVQLHR